MYDFVDTPVKRYSSGMNARLGFAIAAHVDPEVLVIDEVLSVGDAAFQKRCLERMRDFKRSGVAIVFVSHNLQAVADLCDRAVFLRSSPQALGPTQDVLKAYLASLSLGAHSAGGQPIDILGAQLIDSAGTPIVQAMPGERGFLRVRYRANQDVCDFHFGVALYRSTDGLVVYDGNVQGIEVGLASVVAGQDFSVEYAVRLNLVRGQYHFELHVCHNPTQVFFSRLGPVGLITVFEDRTYAGIADLSLMARTVADPDDESARQGASAQRGYEPV